MKTQLTVPDRAEAEALRTRGFRTYEDFAFAANGEVVGRSGNSLTRRIPADDRTPGQPYYLKVYRYVGSRLRGRFRSDKGCKEARNYGILRSRCRIHVPDVIAYGHRRSRWRLLDAFILTRGVPNAVPLAAFLEGLEARKDTERRGKVRAHLFETIAEIVSRMHAAGFYHVDLQWRNLLVSDDGSEHPKIYLIDSERGSIRRWSVHRAHGRLRDLSSLQKDAARWLSNSEQIRWLRRYLGVDKLSPEHRALIRTIQRDRSIKNNGASQ